MNARPRLLALPLLAFLPACGQFADMNSSPSSSWNGPSVYRSGYGTGYGTGYGGPFGWSGYGRSYDDDDNRFVRTDKRTVCDRGTQTCYKRGEIDASETRDQFGSGAARRADTVRDQYGGDTFVRSRNVACDRGDRVCYKNGHADRSETRAQFGKKAARDID